jgi:hypothetical protein
MRIVEDTPRLSVSQLKALPSWPEIKTEEHVSISLDGQLVELELTSDSATYGERWWFVCPQPRCHSRRRHLFLADGELMCRRCGKLQYLEHAWPDSIWRREIGRPVLRAHRSMA